MTRYCLFDLDGTLTDPETGIVASLRHALSAVGIAEVEHERLRTMIGPPLPEGLLLLGVPPERLDEAIHAYRERYTDGMYENEVIEGIPAVLEALVADGWTLAVATSKPAVYAEKILVHFGLDGFFAYVAGATLDGSRRHKADVVRHALDVLGAPPEAAVMIGDRREDVAGAATCRVRSIAVTWGFGEVADFADPGLVAVVDTPERLLDVLSQTAIPEMDTPGGS
ncbi:phosphoglycolate phosphatase [Microbispora rosea]|uniref:Phosphoglycolate phosphatase n=1 Tax=Microbispora rosea TaxID=58117 RepID=A0A1N7GWP3_9ACTN|nr:HAD hydrolase-like protein [Microbispora rosea]GIH52377.1 5'-nucleotidase [Microbispora rosea subsp. rosea]SIS16994.1 phosphoglycolate phosphatase [Microbispora rosea]